MDETLTILYGRESFDQSLYSMSYALAEHHYMGVAREMGGTIRCRSWRHHNCARGDVLHSLSGSTPANSDCLFFSPTHLARRTLFSVIFDLYHVCKSAF